MTIFDMVSVASATTGTGTLTLGTVQGGYQSWANAGIANNTLVSYNITDTANTWEVGTGTYITNSSGNFLQRTTIRYSSNSSSPQGPINCSGNEIVTSTFLDYDYNTFSPSNSINIGANLVINSSVFFFGNSTANTFGNSTIELVANSTAQTVITPTSVATGPNPAAIGHSVSNSTANAVLGIGTLTLAGAGSNTGLSLGTFSAAATGYTFLPNGLLLQWGANTANSTQKNISYPVPFPNHNFAVTYSFTNLFAGTGIPIVGLVGNLSVFAVTTQNATSTSIYWMAIGN